MQAPVESAPCPPLDKTAEIEGGGEAEQGVGPDFVALYAAHYGRLVRAIEIAGADRSTAEDVAQEAFARTLTHWWRVRRGTNPPGYLYRVGFRLARRRAPDTFLSGDEAGPLDVASEATTRVSIDMVLAQMPPRRRSCAVACLVVGMSPKEAGRALGIADSTVRKQLELAREEMRAALGG